MKTFDPTRIELLHEAIPNLGPGKRAFLGLGAYAELVKVHEATPEAERDAALAARVRELYNEGRVHVVEDSGGAR